MALHICMPPQTCIFSILHLLVGYDPASTFPECADDVNAHLYDILQRITPLDMCIEGNLIRIKDIVVHEISDWIVDIGNVLDLDHSRSMFILVYSSTANMPISKFLAISSEWCARKAPTLVITIE